MAEFVNIESNDDSLNIDIPKVINVDVVEFVNVELNDDSLNIPKITNVKVDQNFNSFIYEIEETDIPKITNVDVDQNSNSFIYEVEETDIPKITNVDVDQNSNSFIYEVEETDNEFPDQERIMIHNSCDVSKFYGDPKEDDSFKRKNLFSELVDEFQRVIARRNLGISDKYSLTWGAITGNITQQTDLYNFITSLVNELMSGVNVNIEQRLNDWYDEINSLLISRASIESPIFTGKPQTTTPNIDDNSNRIPTTEWINSKLLSLEEAKHLTFISLSKSFMYIDETDITTILTWEYDFQIESQSINGINIPTNVRSFTFSNINSGFTIELKYSIDGSDYTKIIIFEKITPNYYGKDIDQLIKTKNNFFTINCDNGEYCYIYIPNGSNSRIAVDNIVGGFVSLGIRTITNTIYYVYKTYHSGLGFLNINIL